MTGHSCADLAYDFMGTASRWPYIQLRRTLKGITSGTSVNATDIPAEESEVGVLKTSCVYSGVFDPSENKRVIDEDLERVTCPLTADRLVVSRMNTPELVGATGLVREKVDNLFLPDRLWLVEFSDADPAFVYWWTQSPSYRDQVRSVCAGTSSSMQNLSLDEFKSFLCPHPPLPEQKAIAASLDRETGKIDALVEEQRRLIALLKEKRQAVISHAVTKGLDPAAPMKPSGIDWLGDIPAHWEVTQLKRTAAQGTSITYGIVQAGPMLEEGVPYIRTGDMSGDSLPSSGYPLTSPEIDAAYERSRVFPGDLVIAIRATIGKVLAVPDDLPVANLTQGTAKFAPGDSIRRDYALWAISSDASQHYFSLHSKGATFKEITLDALRRLPVALPPLDEQCDIENFIGKRVGALDALTVEATRAIALLQERRAALISAAVTGKIDVRDTTDETEAA